MNTSISDEVYERYNQTLERLRVEFVKKGSLSYREAQADNKNIHFNCKLLSLRLV